MARRNYRNGQATTLAFPVGALDTTIEVNSATSFPTQYPYTLIIEPDGALEEVVDVTNGTGNLLTVTRGVDGTTASAHSAGVQVYHGVSARDHDEANAHVNATTNVHGTSGSLVDTASTQSIPGQKDFALLRSAGAAVVDVSSVQTIGGTKTFSTKPAVTGTALVDTTTAQTISGAKTWTGPEVHSGTEAHSGTASFSNDAMRPTSAVSSVDESNYTGTAFTPGTNATVGLTFVAPPSGMVYATLSGYFNQAIDGQVSIMSYAIRTGGTIGAGSEVFAASADRALTAGRAVNAGSPPQPQASRRSLLTGLTPGATYNGRVEFQTTAGGNVSVFVRELLIEPVF